MRSSGKMVAVLTVRRTPRARVAVSAMLASLESVVALVLAHLAAGGRAPDAVWLIAFGALVYVASVIVLRRRASIRMVLPVLVAAQVLGHAWLVALAPGAHAGHVHDAGGLLGLSPAMLGAHVLAAVVTATMWVLRRRVIEVVLCWTEQPASVVADLRHPRPTSRVTVPPIQFRLSIAPTRGPPVGLAPIA